MKKEEQIKIAKTLQDALDICEKRLGEKSNDSTNTYPYNYGWLQSAVKNAIEDLRK